MDSPTKLGRSSLSKACWNGRIEVVEKLVSAPGIDLNKQDHSGRTALHNACWGPNGGRLGMKAGLNPKDSPECAYVSSRVFFNGILVSSCSWSRSKYSR